MAVSFFSNLRARVEKVKELRGWEKENGEAQDIPTSPSLPTSILKHHPLNASLVDPLKGENQGQV
jgi:hypothetical protein